MRRCAGHVARHRRLERLRQPCEARHKHLAIAERGDPQVAEEYLPIIHLVFANLKTWLNGTITGSVTSTCKPTSTNSPSGSTGVSIVQRLPFLLGIAGDVTASTYAELYPELAAYHMSGVG